MFRDNHCDDLIDELVEDVKNRLELAALCPNCHKLPSECLDKESVKRHLDNFVPGARVKISKKVRFIVSGSHSQETVTLGNPAVERLGVLYPDLNFSSFTSSGLPLSVTLFNSCMYVYDCSQ